MSILLTFHPGIVEAAEAAYFTSEFSLDYKPERKSALALGGIQGRIDRALHVTPKRWLVIADTLVMTFSSPAAQLASINAYTNREHWSRAMELPLPVATDAGCLCLADPPPDADRIDLGAVPRFEYCEQAGRLRVTLGRCASRYYRVSTCLIVGVEDSAIASLDFSDLRVSDSRAVPG